MPPCVGIKYTLILLKEMKNLRGLVKYMKYVSCCLSLQ